MRWEYYEKNANSGYKVATLYNSAGEVILDVYEDRSRHMHHTVPRVPFIRPCSVSFLTEARLIAKEIKDTDSVYEVLRKRLIAGCREIEKNYKKQIANN